MQCTTKCLCDVLWQVQASRLAGRLALAACSSRRCHLGDRSFASTWHHLSVHARLHQQVLARQSIPLPCSGTMYTCTCIDNAMVFQPKDTYIFLFIASVVHVVVDVDFSVTWITVASSAILWPPRPKVSATQRLPLNRNLANGRGSYHPSSTVSGQIWKQNRNSLFYLTCLTSASHTQF